MMRLGRFLLILGALSLAQPTWADNTTSNGAYSILVGGTAAEAFVSTTGPVERWYTTRTNLGRSYCVETQGGVFFDTSTSAFNLDTVLTVYQTDATTVIGTIDDIAGNEPPGRVLSRVCFVSAQANGALIYIKTSALFGAFNVRTRIAETTLFSNWFFLGSDYGAFTLIRNTTTSVVNYTINWRNGAGTIVATTSGTLNANAGTAVNAGSFPGAVGAVSGTVEIAHDGSAGAIFATTTVLSGTTGLSFDTSFAARPTW